MLNVSQYPFLEKLRFLMYNKKNLLYGEITMRMEHLEVFLDLCETLNFTHTAKNMNMTQSAVSQIIQLIESELNVDLFIRNNRKVLLNDSGQSFFDDVSSILLSYNLAVERIRDLDSKNKKKLIIGYTGTNFEVKIIPQIIREFNKQVPNVQLSLINSSHNLLKHKLLSSECDIILQTLDSVEHMHSIEFTHLISGKFVFILPKEHPLKNRKTITYNDLENETIILLNHNQCPPEQEKIQTIIKENVKHATFLYSDSITLSHSMVEGHAGIAIMPNFVTLNDFTNEDLISIPLDYEVVLNYGLATLKETSNHNMIKIFKHIVQEYIN